MVSLRILSNGKSRRWYVAIFIIILLLLPVVFVNADDPPPSGGGDRCTPDRPCLPNPLGTVSFTELLDRFTNYIFVISIPLAVIMIIIGAFQMMFAAGAPDKVEQARKTIIYTLIGFLVILTSKSVILVIRSLLSSR